MVKLTRKSDRRNIVAGRRTFFAGCKTFMERRFFEAQNEAELFIDVLRTNTLAGKFKLLLNRTSFRERMWHPGFMEPSGATLQ